MADPEGSREENPGNRRKIRVCKKGPYRVTGGVPLATQRIALDSEGYSRRWQEETRYPLQEEYILCRCGRSHTKPFCDGFHTKIKFTGKESASREPYIMQAEEIKGPDLRLTDALIFCASARFCDRAGGIWDLTMRSKDQEAKRTAIEEAGNCPSGRLVVWDKTTKKAIEPVFEPSIEVVEYPQKGLHGPIWVRGGIPIESAKGILYEIRNRVTLCRCGQSRNKPVCDSSHLRWSGNRPLRPSAQERRE